MHKNKNILTIKIIQTIHFILINNYKMNNIISNQINNICNLNINIINNNNFNNNNNNNKICNLNMT